MRSSRFSISVLKKFRVPRNTSRDASRWLGSEGLRGFAGSSSVAISGGGGEGEERSLVVVVVDDDEVHLGFTDGAREGVSRAMSEPHGGWRQSRRRDDVSQTR